jgi:hypothetical protein
MSLSELETDQHIDRDDLRDINQRIFLPMPTMALICATFAFLSIYGLYLIVGLLWYWKHRNHYPIRGKAPLLSLLFMASLIGAIYLPVFAEIFWNQGWTNSRTAADIHPLNKLMGCLYFICRRGMYFIYLTKMVYIWY